jgi:hypothetical protein
MGAECFAHTTRQSQSKVFAMPCQALGNLERENRAKRISPGDGGMVLKRLFDSQIFRQAIQLVGQ